MPLVFRAMRSPFGAMYGGILNVTRLSEFGKRPEVLHLFWRGQPNRAVHASVYAYLDSRKWSDGEGNANGESGWY